MGNYSAWQQKHAVFGDGNYYRRIQGDSQAVLLTRRNANAIARVCGGTVVRTGVDLMVIFQGPWGREILLEDQYFVRTIIPGNDFFFVLTPLEFEEQYTSATPTIELGVNDVEDAEVRPEAVLGGGGAGDAGEPDGGAGVVRRRAVPRFGEAGAIRQGRGAASYL